MVDLYQPLQPGQIRVLKLKPGCLPQNGLDLQFQIVNLTAPPGQQVPWYTAISYTWGTAQPTELVHIDGHEFYIRPNLKRCLDHVFGNSQVMVWADAICINQNDDDERSNQVRQMSSVYSQATKVVSWLEDADSAKGVLSSIKTKISDVVDGFDQREARRISRSLYWTRAWITQEFILADQLEAIWRGKVLSANELETMVSNLHPTLYHDWSRAMYLISTRRTFRSEYQRSAGPYTSLFALLTQHMGTRAGEPRDKIFSLLSLVHADEAERLLRLFPDYSLTLDQVLIGAIAHLRCQIPEQWWMELEGVLLDLGIHSIDQLKLIASHAQAFQLIYSHSFGASNSTNTTLAAPATNTTAPLSLKQELQTLTSAPNKPHPQNQQQPPAKVLASYGLYLLWLDEQEHLSRGAEAHTTWRKQVVALTEHEGNDNLGSQRRTWCKEYLALT